MVNDKDIVDIIEDDILMVKNKENKMEDKVNLGNKILNIEDKEHDMDYV